MTRESEDLATHVEICAIRYKGIEDRFEQVESRLTSIEIGLKEIKELIEVQTQSRFNVIVNAAATVIVALLGTLGYIVLHLK